MVLLILILIRLSISLLRAVLLELKLQMALFLYLHLYDGILDSTSGDLFLFNQSAGLADPVLDSGSITMFLHGVPELNPFIELIDTMPLYLGGLDLNTTSSGSLDLRIIGQPIINSANNGIAIYYLKLWRYPG